MRIIAGTLKGRKLAAPEDQSIRPTSDRTRESLFNLLMHGQYAGSNILNQPVADLCCGTGALGLEAISRGASSCVFIDQSRKAIALAKQNALHCGVANQCHFIEANASKLPATTRPCALVLMDAPYDTPLTSAAYASLRAGGWFAPGAWFVVEQPRQADAPILEGAACLDSRTYGKTTLHIWQVG